jgi:uncharacterized protein
MSLFAMFVTIAHTAYADVQVQPLRTLPSFPKVPVLDEAGIIPAVQEQALNTRVVEFEKKTSMQIRLVTQTDVSPYATTSAYAEDLYHVWKLGDKNKHNGLLLVISQRIGSPSEDMKDYCRIMTGWGIVTMIPDEKVALIKRENMTPRLPSQPYLAFDNALDKLFIAIEEWKSQHPEDNTAKNEAWKPDAPSEQNSASAVSSTTQDEDSGFRFFIIVVVGLGLFGALIFFFCSLFSTSSSSSSTYYRSSEKRKNDSGSSGCSGGFTGCSSGGDGGCGGGGGGCGGGGD